MRILIPVLAIVAAAVVHAQPSAPPPAPFRAGDVAPDFSLPYATRDSVARDSLRLSSFAGRSKVVLAFYPADWSGGCTKEVCMLRDHFAALGELEAVVVGISGDYVFSHHEWAKHHDLPFALASDHDHAVARRYGSYLEGRGFNRRTVFAIDRQGRVGYADMAYSVRDSVSLEKLKVALRQMN